MSIRRLFAPLLLLPLLLGASVQRVEVRAAPEGGTTFVAIEAIDAGPALPGTAAISQISAFDAPAPVRTHVRQRGDLAVHDRTTCPAARAASLERDYLRYARELKRARLSLPAACGNPPPLSAS